MPGKTQHHKFVPFIIPSLETATLPSLWLIVEIFFAAFSSVRQGMSSLPLRTSLTGHAAATKKVASPRQARQSLGFGCPSLYAASRGKGRPGSRFCSHRWRAQVAAGG